jgi:hypothetical protein
MPQEQFRERAAPWADFDCERNALSARGTSDTIECFTRNEEMLTELLTRQAQPRMLMWWMLTRILPVTFWPNAVAGVKEL